jgi:DNA polymerase-1
MDKKEVIQETKKVKKEAPKNQLQFDLFGDNGANESQVADSREVFKKEDDTIVYKLVDTPYEINELISKLQNVSEFCFDTETTGLDTNKAEIIGVAFSFKAKEAYYVMMPDNFEQTKAVLNMFSVVFGDSEKLIIGQNLKYDISVLWNYDIKVEGKLFDTMIAHYLIEPEQKHGLDFLSSKYLSYRMISIEELIGPKGKNQKNMKDIDPLIVSDL